MPILIKNFTWSQTHESVRVSVPLKAANTRTTLDLFTQPGFIKVNASPYFLELFLAHSIDAVASTTKVYENEIKFQLRKSEPGVEWLTLDRQVEKADTVLRKEAILDTAHEQAKRDAADRQKRSYEIKQKEVLKEIEREGAIRNKVDALEKEALGQEMKAVEGIKSQSKKKVVDPKSEHRLKLLNKPPKLVANSKANAPMAAKAPPKVVVPSVRQRGQIDVEFSARTFPTPMRESQEAQEQEWILKQGEARKAIGFVEEDLRPEERNLDWLKEKGNDFFQKKNYLGAVSAFTTAIRMNPKCYELYLNRATCHYALENYNRCVEDSSKSFELLVPAVPSNLKARSQCLAKRGAALCKLGYLRQGHDELEAALKLMPNNETLRKDIATVEQAMRETSDN